MKIIQTDNYCRDEVADKLIVKKISSKKFAQGIADYLNKKESGESPYFFVAVDDNYRLCRGMEDLI